MSRIRIIGGHWRGRRLSSPDAPGLRPTPDRVRETLFNWLAPVIEGARCLDLFAGSGALGLEALSRGAAEAVLVERDRRIAEQLREHVRTLQADAKVVQADTLRFLQQAGRPYDEVFLDPPYGRGWLPRCAALLEANDWLADDAWLYLEAEQPLGSLAWPGRWSVTRDRAAGQVHYGLVQRDGSASTGGHSQQQQ